MDLLEIETLEITKENIAENLKEICNEIKELWEISDKNWKELPDLEKKDYYKKDKQLHSKISNMIIETFEDFKDFGISEFGALVSKDLDLSINIHDNNIEIERGTFKTQEYQYKLIEFKKENFEKNLFEFCEKNIRWYLRNDGVPN